MARVHVRDGAANVWTPIRSVVGPALRERMNEGELSGEFKPHDRGDPEGLELLEIYYPPNAAIAVHAHEEDEILYVVDGAIRLGDRVYGKGSSVFVARGTLYGFEAGPEGLHMVNFRARPDHSFITRQEYLDGRKTEGAAPVPESPGRDNPLLAKLAPRPGRYPLIPDLSARQELALLCRTLHREGYDDHIAGHITLAEPDGSFLVNPWELAWDELTASDILRVDAEGRVIEGDWNVTPAIGLHLAVHRRRHDLRVVLHNHSRWGSIWSASGRVPPVYDQASGYVGGDPVFYDEYAGTVDGAAQAEAAAEALGQDKWALLKNHGVFLVADSIRQAHLRAITLEHRCRLAWHVEVLGEGEPIANPETLRVAQMSDSMGFPFLWEAMARREIRLDPSVLG